MREIDLLEELNSISKTHSLQRNDIDQIMVEFAGRITRSLGIERMSVWLIDFQDKEMTSIGEYDLRNESFDKENTLPMSLCPEYFVALEKDELLYVPNVLESPITSGLKASYSIPNDIITLLDIPLRFEGNMIGVMCFEKTGKEVKVFNQRERFFANAISMVFSSNLEARKRRALQADLDQELREKETLLKEIHHRVKNNLSVVSSLINLQSGKAKDAYHRQLLDDCRGKVQSIADFHEIVYQNNTYSAVNVRTYFSQLLQKVLEFYDNDTKIISVNLDIAEFELSTEKIIPLGLIVNEVVTNSFKHAFSGRSEGNIFFHLDLKNGKIQLDIRDDGNGFNPDRSNASRLGMEIVHDLAGQIDGSFDYSSENGVSFQLSAPLK